MFEELLISPASPYHQRTVNQGGHLGAPLINTSLGSPQGGIVVRQGGVRPFPGPVVGDEDDHGVGVSARGLQSLNNTCYRIVQLLEVFPPEQFQLLLPTPDPAHPPGVALGEEGEVEEERLVTGSLLDQLNRLPAIQT